MDVSIETIPAFSVSRQDRDETWDGFLSACPSGQFQQSSLWAQAKGAESWECARLLAKRDGRLLGGAQILFRTTRFGRIGYINKGPMLAPGEEGFLQSVLKEIHVLGRSLDLRAWILQSPDDADWQIPVLRKAGYLPADWMKIIDSTLLLDLSRSWDEILGSMNRSSRQRAHQTERGGIRIREGTGEDVGIFFELMTKTCQRQKTRPNPGSARALLELWRAFIPEGKARLTFAEMEGKPLAGLLCLVFGQRVTFWKKGWDPSPNHPPPNELLHLEAIKWAWEHRYRYCDFVAVDRGIANAMLGGRPLSSAQKHSRHLFNIKLGATPRLLPQAVVYVTNPVARGIFRAAGRIPLLTGLLGKATMGLGR